MPSDGRARGRALAFCRSYRISSPAGFYLRYGSRESETLGEAKASRDHRWSQDGIQRTYLKIRRSRVDRRSSVSPNRGEIVPHLEVPQDARLA
jgi:hypothetical protein